LAARVIDGKALAAELKEQLTTEAEALIHARTRPGLATVMAGYDGAVEAYERRARYVPSTPAACFYMLDSYLAGSGRDPAELYSRSNVVVVGRSKTVGSPAVSSAFSRNATVVSCDEHAYKAGRLREHTLKADALIVAAGVPGFITSEYVRDRTIAIDVGTNPVENPRTGEIMLVGDLDFESVAAKAEAISPVPGGVGTITYVCLLENTAHAAKLAADLKAGGDVSKTETESEQRNTAAVIGASI
jgi:5,10-methylene-tetrahydrofolate dehydrogenase/methenyl tetrahydrofolate cyclohydrolase